MKNVFLKNDFVFLQCLNIQKQVRRMNTPSRVDTVNKLSQLRYFFYTRIGGKRQANLYQEASFELAKKKHDDVALFKQLKTHILSFTFECNKRTQTMVAGSKERIVEFCVHLQNNPYNYDFDYKASLFNTTLIKSNRSAANIPTTNDIPKINELHQKKTIEIVNYYNEIIETMRAEGENEKVDYMNNASKEMEKLKKKNIRYKNERNQYRAQTETLTTQLNQVNKENKEKCESEQAFQKKNLKREKDPEEQCVESNLTDKERKDMQDDYKLLELRLQQPQNKRMKFDSYIATITATSK